MRDRTPLLATSALVLGLWLLARETPRAQSSPSWTPIGPSQATIFALARDPFDGQVLIAGTYFGGLYKTTDRGTNWTHVPGPHSTFSVFAIAFDPSTAGTIYIGTYGEGVYKSVDGGLTWVPRNEGLADPTVQALAVDPFDPNGVIAVTSTGPFRTVDGGETWNVSSTPIPAQSVAFDRHSSGVVYLGSQGDGVYKSTDGGATFLPFNAGMTGRSVLTLAFDQHTGTVLLAGTSDSFAYKLMPGASVWTDITNNLPSYPVYSIVTLPSDNRVLYLASGAGTFLSPDQGATWYGSLATPSRVLATDDLGFVTFVATTNQGLRATINMGASWFDASRGLQNTFVGGLAATVSGGRSILHAASELGVFLGLGNPPEWSRSGSFDHLVQDVVANPIDARVLYAATERRGVWKTTDAGQSWAPASNGLVPSKILSLSGSPVAPYRVYAGTPSGLYISRDNGATWTPGTASAIPQIHSVATDTVRGDVAYFGTTGGAIYRTIDGGQSFALANSGIATGATVTTIKVTPQYADIVYAITSAGELFVTQNGGGGWFRAAHTVPEPILSVDMDPVSPWVVYLGTAGGGVYKSLSGGAVWDRTSLPSSYVFSIVVDPGDPEEIYAGTSAGVYRSSDSGESWSNPGSGLPNGAVTALHLSRSGTSTLFATVEYAGLYTSSDSGATWTPVSGLPPTAVMPITETGGTTSMLMVGTDLEGVFATSDHGAIWTKRSEGMYVFVRGLAIDPQAPDTLYASAVLGGVFKTVDGGGHWRNAGLNDAFVMRVAVDPTNSQIVYAATSQGVRRSMDGGSTWHITGQRTGFAFGLISDPRDRNVVYLAADAGGVYRSADGSHSWTTYGHGLPVTNILAIALDSLTGDLFASPERGGIWKRGATSTSWAPSAGTGAWRVLALTADPASGPGVMYAAAGAAGIHKTSDGGQAWHDVSNGLAGEFVVALTVDPSEAGTVYAGTFAQPGVSPRPLFKTADGGGHWLPASAGLTATGVQAIAVHPTDGNIAYAATEVGVFKSSDGGATWTLPGALTPRHAKALLLDPSNADVIYASGSDQGAIVKSTDGGMTWVDAGGGLPAALVGALAAGPSSGTVYAGTLGSGIFRTTDAGLSWEGGVQPESIAPFTLAVAVHPTNPSTVFAATGGVGVLRSLNRGDDWHTMGQGLEDAGLVLCITIDAAAPDIMYVGTVQSGVYMTRNGGLTWTPLSSGLFNGTVTALAVDPLDHTVVYAGTEGGGIFRLTGHLP